MTDPDPLKTALAASRPIPASNVEECRQLLEIEHLLDSDKRRVSVAQHEAFRASIQPEPEGDEL